MSELRINYDGVQHCTALQESQGKIVAMDACPETGGKGEEFSPMNLAGAGLAGCMLFSMGMVARPTRQIGYLRRARGCESPCNRQAGYTHRENRPNV
jgi:uncharacterized OsmC-like protein